MKDIETGAEGRQVLGALDQGDRRGFLASSLMGAALAALGAAPETSAQEARPVAAATGIGEAINVRMLGAKGDGVTDDTAAIATAVSKLRAGGQLFFPEGTYAVSSMLTLEALAGARIAGAGTLRSQLRWVGSGTASALLRMWGCRDCVLENLSIVSDPRHPLGVGIRSETRRGSTSSNNVYRNLNFSGTGAGGLDRGMEFIAGDGGNANNDENLFDTCVFKQYAVAGIDIRHSQSAVHVFSHCGFGSYGAGPSSIGINAEAGVFFTAIGCSFAGHTEADIRYRGATPPTQIIGCLSENSRHFLVTGDAPYSIAPIVIIGGSFNTGGIHDDHRVIDCRFRGPLLLLGFSVIGSDSVPAEIFFDSSPNRTYSYAAIGCRVATSLADPFGASGKPPNVKLACIVDNSQQTFVPNVVSDLGGLSGGGPTLGSATQARNLRGAVTIAGPEKSALVTFAASEADASYFVTHGVSGAVGNPAPGATRTFVTNKAPSGFTVNLESAPGVGRSVTVDWMLIR